MPPTSQLDPNPRERYAFLAAISLVLAAFAWFVLRPLMPPVLLAVLTAVIVFPVNAALRRRLAGRHAPAAIGTLAILTAGVVVPAWGFLILFVSQARQVLAEIVARDENRSRLADLADQVTGWVTRLAETTFGNAVDADSLLQESTQKLAGALTERIPDLFGQVGRFAFGALLFYLVLFILLLRGRSLLDFLVELSPMGEDHSRRILRRLERTIKGVFLGTLATALIQGAIGALGFWLTGFENHLIWGALLAGAGVIPIVGTGLVWVPAVIYLLLAGQTSAALWMLVIGGVVSTVDNVVKPLLIHDQARVHPLLVFMGVFGGLASFGPMGLLYGPLLVACLVEMVRIYDDDFRPRADAGPGPPAPSSPPG